MHFGPDLSCRTACAQFGGFLGPVLQPVQKADKPIVIYWSLSFIVHYCLGQLFGVGALPRVPGYREPETSYSAWVNESAF